MAADFCKPVREVDDAYRAWVASKPCVVGIGCEGDIAPHHLDSSGVGSKGSDFSCVPLCWRHHIEIHTLGQRTMGDKFFLDLWHEAWRLVNEWRRLGNG